MAEAQHAEDFWPLAGGRALHSIEPSAPCSAGRLWLPVGQIRGERRHGL